ncbi:uncharacterized protein BDCG_08743 [Blastomyces dermatitidis ER-3]|uniref:Regulatory P domain-containing protein n=3 Tax=Blastomyces TaxID=229219 RepID=A0A179V4B3_BLAGS|nr:uncharacterized protein BDBG_09370 [Blastomyces gilchristii SLH14081]XP_045273219.1 uncharacterized protein BDCG_08743 [Blastomyces dermatitidis ER-3]EGE82369.1 hypothetical protein BDDG_05313 [Blastomyces dermatitidis ATCC 18188]EQL34974.1 hypothetical protein BDFG_03193 [Blastomyces dermatitidis ATCC 26199]EEQ85474.1 hypothetical protein BDCG_08743 [Blastomyces dermatitidis ER-3]OAT14308.1 hypothetical protein BDBG_09370 [Blastomyces gilchristii SLH14081]
MKLSLLAPLVAAGLAVAGSLQAEKNMLQMQRLMDMKLAAQEKLRKEGFFDEGRFKSIKREERCVNGKAGEFSCKNVDMTSFLSHQDMGSRTRRGNDVWGWNADDGREFVAVGQTDGTAFVEVLKGGKLKYLGRLPTQTQSSTWRDMKVIDGYVYIGSEAPGHGLQVFDMRKLAKVKGRPVTYDIRRDLTAWFRGFGSSHNIVAHEDAKMIYAVGTGRTTPCRGGLYMVDVSNPARPTSPGCASQDGYVHDAQCVIYDGPDERYTDRQICFNYNEDTLTIVDVTDKSNPVQISSTPYEGASYTHQGWIADEDMEYLLLDDELDESDGTNPGKSGHTTTYIVNISNLAKPRFTGFYQSPVKSIDHNQYVIDGLAYQSNYGSGLRIVDVSSVTQDATGKGFKEVGFFDCHPEDDSVGGKVEFVGSWSVYPYFKSGTIVLNSIERGLFALKYNPE